MPTCTKYRRQISLGTVRYGSLADIIDDKLQSGAIQVGHLQASAQSGGRSRSSEGTNRNSPPKPCFMKLLRKARQFVSRIDHGACALGQPGRVSNVSL
jgi:hypothetical protein